MSPHSIRQTDRWLVLETGAMQLVADLRHGTPFIRHLGAPLQPGEVEQLDAATGRPLMRATLDVEAPALVCPEPGSGWQGRPGLIGRRSDGSAWSPRFSPADIAVTDHAATVTAVDPVAALTITTVFELHPESVRISLRVRNDGTDDYHLDELLVGVPVPQRAAELAHLVGNWSHEFQLRRRAFSQGMHGFDNRRGRTSHDRIPAIWAGTAGWGENHGEVWGFTLGWSGHAVVNAEYLTDGRRFVQLGEALAPGEVTLAPGEEHHTPRLEVAWSPHGANGTSHAFHQSIRSGPNHPTRRRPIVLNTWEAVYFDHDLATLSSLADRFAAIGGERFVLDDGWFHSRRSDNAGLGDWWVDPAVWPDGITPLVDHVTGLGLEFGIWVEPEMVNPDSDLYRAHPEWALHVDGYEPVLGRNQLVLNLGLEDVRDHLFFHLDALLRDHDVSYVKWDMNRDLIQAGDGRRAAHHQHMLGVYELFDRVRAAHPGVEIESCSSGGARADFEILARTERIWASDSNDPLERQRIQRGFSRLFPPEIMGAHIGPPRSHTSGRSHSLGFRAATAFFGHLGLEWNLLDLGDAELDDLKRILDLHKQHRPLLHSGRVWRLDVDDPAAVSHVVVSPDRSEAMLSFCQFDLPEGSNGSSVRIPGLDAERTYHISLLPIAELSSLAARQVSWVDGGTELSGSMLATVGLHMPLLNPESAVAIHFDGR